ncbi:MAG TPA: hypothetical protein VFX86_00280 [Candidatus Saccharimonadales bacterium]|nr:hypothetical protein [Candidatus Saccharimonadales bacterium]
MLLLEILSAETGKIEHIETVPPGLAKIIPDLSEDEPGFIAVACDEDDVFGLAIRVDKSISDSITPEGTLTPDVINCFSPLFSVARHVETDMVMCEVKPDELVELRVRHFDPRNN